MAYKLIISEHADQLLDVSQMNYVVVFDINDDCVNILGVFHQLENYRGKL